MWILRILKVLRVLFTVFEDCVFTFKGEFGGLYRETDLLRQVYVLSH